MDYLDRAQMKGYRYALQTKIPYGKVGETAVTRTRTRLNEPGILLALAEYELSKLEEIRAEDLNRLKKSRWAYSAKYYSEHREQWKRYAQKHV